MTPDAVLRELDGLRALARSLVHGDADADDLIQETAIAAMKHPPDDDRPVRPWLATVLRNRWRMDRRARSRREAREQVIAERDEGASTDDAIDRARTLEMLATALVALDEPYRTVVIRRYLDGQTASAIARSLGIPAGTVRWRLKTGLERLRAALDKSTPRWHGALLPLAAQGVLVKTKTAAVSIVVFLLLIAASVAAFVKLRDREAPAPVASAPANPLVKRLEPGVPAFAGDPTVALPDPLPGQGRAVVETIDAAGGAIGGRVINWSTGDGVTGAELTFTSGGIATTIRTDKAGRFELAPPLPGRFSLAAVVAPGFLPFAPELAHSTVNVDLAARQAVRGITLFLFPALDYYGHVVDASGAPVAGARVRLSGTPADEQALEKLVTEWTTDAKGKFIFHAPDFAVFEASLGKRRGWAMLDMNVATTKNLVITLGDAPARDATIRGKTTDPAGAPLADVLVRAIPEDPPGKEPAPRALAFATSGPDGAFVLEGLDRGTYSLVAEDEDRAPATKENVTGGTQHVVLALDPGLAIGGTVVTPDGAPVPSYTLLVTQRVGLVRSGLVSRSVVDPRGRFEVRVPKGDYELLVSAYGWASAEPARVSAGTKDARITVSAGATLRGIVRDADTAEPLQYARVNREGGGGGASVQVANAGTVTRADGTFELTGIPAGPFTISVGAGGYHPRLEAGLVAADGGVVGPIDLRVKKLAEGEQPKLELVGIGVKLSADGETLRVEHVFPESGAAAAGMLANDRITALDGVAVTTLGMDGAIARIRGAARTTISVTLLRDNAPVTLVVERKPMRV